MKKKVSLISIVAILTLFICTGGGTLENSALQTMIEAWPGVSVTMIRMLTTLPSFVSMFVMIIVGRIVGRKISYRHSVIFGLVCMLAGGLTPFLIHGSWYFVLACRALMGLGVGFAALGNPLLMRTLSPEELARYIGLGGIIGNLASVILNPVTGTLTKTGWQYAFLSNAVYLIPFVLCLLFLKEPEKIEEPAESEKKKTSLPKAVYVFIIMQFFSTMVLYPLLSGISTYLSSIGITDTAVAGTMLSVYTGGGVCANLLLPSVKKLLGRNTMIYAYSLVVLGVFIVISMHNVLLITAGIFLSGMGFITLMQMYQVYNGLICTKEQVAKASTMVLAANQLGVFLSSFFINLSGNIGIFANEIANTLFMCLVIYVIMALIMIVLKKKLLPAE